MPRLSIEISPEQHKLIKANAALQGKSLKEFILERAMHDITADEQAALTDLQEELRPALENARKGAFSKRQVGDIITAMKAQS